MWDLVDKSLGPLEYENIEESASPHFFNTPDAPKNVPECRGTSKNDFLKIAPGRRKTPQNNTFFMLGSIFWTLVSKIRHYD